MCKNKLVIVDKSKFIDFKKRGTLVCKYEPGTNKIIIVCAVNGITTSDDKFEGIIIYSRLNDNDLWKSFMFNQNEFEFFQDELLMKN